jgi:hypothetical protein
MVVDSSNFECRHIFNFGFCAPSLESENRMSQSTRETGVAAFVYNDK